MFSKKLTLGLAIGAALTFAGPAQAVVVDTDRPELNGTGYDFGNSSFVAGSPTGGGDLEFDLSGGKIEPRLTGTLHLNDADGTCARMHLEFRDKSGVALTTPKHGGTVCAGDDQHHEYSVDLAPYVEDRVRDPERDEHLHDRRRRQLGQRVAAGHRRDPEHVALLEPSAGSPPGHARRAPEQWRRGPTAHGLPSSPHTD